jgi:outer membrane biosynthesis protein TonB
MSKLKNLKRYRQAEPEAWEQRASGKIPASSEKPKPKPKPKHKTGTPYQNWLVPGIIGLVFLTMIGFVVKIFLSDSGSPKKAMYQVTLIKPPPEDKVKPPEPEKPKEAPKEALPTPVDVPQPEAQANDQPPDNAPPPGADLGVAGEGGSGSDGFGLVGKGKNYKGRDITLGGGGNGMSRLALLTKYGWYTAKIQEEIKKQMRKRLDQEGGIPKGKLQTVIKIVLDAKGNIIEYQIVASSGNNKMDDALKNSLPGFRISQPPPDGMPSAMTVRINSQG